MLDLLFDALTLTALLSLAWWHLGAALKELSRIGKRPFHPYRTACNLIAATICVGGFFYVGGSRL